MKTPDINSLNIPLEQNSSQQASKQSGSLTGDVKRLELPSTTIIPGLAKDIKVGDIINFVMRGRSPDGLGLLYMLGQLVKANVPNHINVGDKVQAKIEKEGDKILFKILGINPQINSNEDPPLVFQKASLPLPQKLEREISNLLLRLNAFLPDSSLQTEAPIKDLASSLEQLKTLNNEEIKQTLKLLEKTFLNGPTLTDPSKLNLALKEATRGKLIEDSKTILTLVKNILEKQTGNPEARFFAKVVFELREAANLLNITTSPENLKSSKEILEKLIKILDREADSEALGKTTKRNFAYFDTVKLIKGELTKIAHPEKLSPQNLEKLAQTIFTLQPEVNNFAKEQPIPHEALRELSKLAANIEQFIFITNLMSQIEPIMSLMQAPEMMLLPFLFPGLLSFGEVAIDPDAHRKQKKKNKDKSNEAELAYRYASSIELPNLGLISMSSLQEGKKIDVRLNTEDDEKTAFLASKVDDLRRELMSKGFIAGEILTETLDLSQSIVIKP